MDADATGACLDALVDSGQVAAIGVSNFLPHDWQLLQSRMRHPLVTNQIELSLAARGPFTDGQLAFAQQHRIRPMAWSPLGGGALMTGASDAGARVLPALRRIADQQGVGAEAVALAWLLAHPAGILPVVGTQRLDRIARLAEAWRPTALNSPTVMPRRSTISPNPTGMPPSRNGPRWKRRRPRTSSGKRCECPPRSSTDLRASCL